MPTLSWIGKDKVVSHHQDVPYRVLDRKYTFGDVPNSGNMIIHGDNLEALKALLPEYEGKIKCIYIDPPYNTGNENWVYNDNVNDPHIRKWLGQVVGSEVDDLTRHDKWLCMMYPRLVLLQKLLREDGAIFISIDDNEQADLKLLGDEVFGIRNFVGELVWKSKSGGANDSRYFAVDHEYVFVYAKSIYKFILYKDKNAEVTTSYNFEDGNGKYALDRLDKQSIRYSDSLNYEIIGPDGESYFPKHKDSNNPNATWRWSKDTVKERYSELVFRNGNVYTKNYQKNESTPRSLLIEDRFGRTRTGKTELYGIFGINTFDNPKPSKLICHLIDLCADKDSIILDSFAGSGTTAHAVLNLNKQDGGNRKFILCEMCDYAENITAERVRRVMKGYGEGKNAVEGTGGSFDFYELGETIFDPATGNLNDNADTEQIRRYVWFSETNSAYIKPNADAHPYLLGTYQHNNYYFYYIKGEETCLDWDFLNTFTQNDKAEMYIIYADRCVLTEQEMTKFNIVFKKIPRDIKRV